MRTRIKEVAGSAKQGLNPRLLGGPDWHVGATATASVPVAIAAAAHARDFEEAVSVAVRCGGDTDTVGAMAGAIAGARFGASAIPSRWVAALEDGERGRSHVERLGVEIVGRLPDPPAGHSRSG
jgi:phage tail tape-measure protein